MPDENENESAAEQQPKSYSLLAKEGFGDNFVGEVKESTTEQDTDDNDDSTEDENLTSNTDTDDDTAGDEDSGGDDASDDDSKEGHISTVEELTDYMKAELDLDVDPEWMDSLTVSGKVRGETVQYKIGEIKEAVQKVDAADSYLEQAKQQGAQQQEEFGKKVNELQSSFVVVAKLIESAETLLAADSENIDWDGLRASDAAEWTAKKQEVADRRAAIDGLKADAATGYQTWIDQGTQDTEAQQLQTMQAEHKSLMEKIPEWTSGKLKEAEKTQTQGYLRSQGFEEKDITAASEPQLIMMSDKMKMHAYLKGMGFTDADITNSADHRLIVLALKAMKFDNTATKTEVSKKKIALVPKTLKSGARKPQGQASKEKLETLRKKAKESGTVEAAFAYKQAQKKAAQQQS